MTDNPYVKIREQTGNYNLADPSETSTQVYISIPELGFEHRFSFPEHFPPITDLPWYEAIEEILDGRHRNISGRTAKEELNTILSEHGEEIQEQWKSYRKQEIDEKIERLKDEQSSL